MLWPDFGKTGFSCHGCTPPSPPLSAKITIWWRTNIFFTIWPLDFKLKFNLKSLMNDIVVGLFRLQKNPMHSILYPPKKIKDLWPMLGEIFELWKISSCSFIIATVQLWVDCDCRVGRSLCPSSCLLLIAKMLDQTRWQSAPMWLNSCAPPYTITLQLPQLQTLATLLPSPDTFDQSRQDDKVVSSEQTLIGSFDLQLSNKTPEIQTF